MIELESQTCSFGVESVMGVLDDQTLDVRLQSEPELLKRITMAIEMEQNVNLLKTAFIKMAKNKSAVKLCWGLFWMLPPTLRRQFVANVAAIYRKEYLNGTLADVQRIGSFIGDAHRECLKRPAAKQVNSTRMNRKPAAAFELPMLAGHPRIIGGE